MFGEVVTTIALTTLHLCKDSACEMMKDYPQHFASRELAGEHI